MKRLNILIDPIPPWTPRDHISVYNIPKWCSAYYLEKAKALDHMIALREIEAEDRENERKKLQSIAALKEIEGEDLTICETL